MAKEIEYKFLIDDVAALTELKPFKSEDIVQGYLVGPDNTAAIRVRISEWMTVIDGVQVIDHTEAFITVKGPAVGLSRDEFEYAIPVEDAKVMMQMCNGAHIVKTRYFLELEGQDDEGYTGNKHIVELDVFGGNLSGLIMAEIEVESEDEAVEFPKWFGRNVSTDKRYTNVSLAYHGMPPGTF